MDFTTNLAQIHVAADGSDTIEAVRSAVAGSLYSALQQVKNGRKRRGRRYPAVTVLTIAGGGLKAIIVLRKMAGESTLVGIAEWAQLRAALLCQVVGLRGLPW